MFFEQIKIFQCLKQSTAQDTSPQIIRIHTGGRCHMSTNRLVSFLCIYIGQFKSKSFTQGHVWKQEIKSFHLGLHVFIDGDNNS